MRSSREHNKIQVGIVATFLALAFAVIAPTNAFAETVIEDGVDSTVTIMLVDSAADSAQTAGKEGATGNATNETNASETGKADEASKAGDLSNVASESAQDNSEAQTSVSQASSTEQTKPAAKNASTANGHLALTGNVVFMPVTALLLLLAGAAYLRSRSKHEALAESGAVSSQRAHNVVLKTAVALSLLALAVFGALSGETPASATNIKSKITFSSAVTVDASGNVQTATVTAHNNSAKEITVENALSSTKLPGWTATFDQPTIKAGESVTGTWNAATISDDLLEQVKDRGSATVTFPASVSYDNREITDAAGRVETLDPSVTPCADASITVSNPDGNTVAGATIEIDKQGTINVTLPQSQKNKSVVIKAEDQDNKNIANKLVSVKNADSTLRGKATLAADGTATFRNGNDEIDFSNAVVDTTNKTYNGKQITPSARITGLKADTDYRVTYGTNTNAGTGSITITGIGSYTGSKTYTFTIAKAPVTPTSSEENGFSVTTTINKSLSDVASLLPKTYGNKAGVFAITKDSNGKAVTSSTSVGSAIRTAKYYATFTPNDGTNYRATENIVVNVSVTGNSSVNTKIKVGDYIKLGTYKGQTIVWRCVSIDNNGPLMLADKVLDTLPYDATTSDNSKTASHSRNGKRATYGSNHWRDSNMRSWLNSDAIASKVDWLCGNAPKAGTVKTNPYADKAGFLNGFTQAEINAIRTTEHRSIVSHPEYAAGYIDGAGTDLPENYDIATVAEGYEKAYAENIIDKVFLLDVKQLNTVYTNLGNYYIAQNTSNVSWPYWLMTPVTDCNHDMRYVESKGEIRRISPNEGYLGVRPAFYLDVDHYQTSSGNGTANSPYIGDAKSKPADTTQISGATKNTGEDNWDIDTDNNLQLTLGTNYSSDGTYANPVVPVYTIQKPRSDTQNMVIIFCADGYKKSEMSKFISDVKRVWQGTLQKEPYKSMANLFNVYALCTSSVDHFGSGNTFFDVVGTYNSAYISNNKGSWKNHILERCIGPNFIEKFHDAHVPNTTDPNNIDIWGDENAAFRYVYNHISQFVVLGNSGTYFGGCNKNVKVGLNYIVAPANYTDASYILTHELGHGLFNLGDEYTYSFTPVGSSQDSTWLNASYTANPEQVKWKNMLGFRNTYSCPHYDGSYIYNPSHMCIMENNTYTDFCDVCKLQMFKRASQLVSGVSSLYVAEPEVKEVTGAYSKLSDFSDATGYGYNKYITDRNSRLLSGSYKNRFSSALKGKSVEMRTIVQNLSDKSSRKVTLKMWVQRKDGSIATTTSGKQLTAEQTYEVPAWDEKPNFFPKGYQDHYGTNFDSGLKNCTLTYSIPTDADIQSGDTIAFTVVDANTNETLATETL